MNTSPVDTLKAMRERIATGEHSALSSRMEAAIDAAIAALSDEQIRTVMRIEHEGRTFSVDGWAGPMVLGWRDAALSRGEAEPIGWVFQHEDTGRMTFCENDGVNNAESFAANNPRHMLCGPAYTTPRAVGDGMVVVPESAIRWLMGEEGSFECPPERYFRGKAPPYWWRSVFREKIAAAPSEGSAQGVDESLLDLCAELGRHGVGVSRDEDGEWSVSLPAATGQGPEGVALEPAAKRLYADYSGNHPTIHCNRFPAWDELSEAERIEWRRKAATPPASSQGDR